MQPHHNQILTKMNEQQKLDYYYGYNLRLADEIGEFDQHIKQPATLQERVELSLQLQNKLINMCREHNHMRAVEIINPIV